jgi:hypothetical protein
MTTTVPCTSCGITLRCPADPTVQAVKCPKCGSAVRVAAAPPGGLAGVAGHVGNVPVHHLSAGLSPVEQGVVSGT